MESSHTGQASGRQRRALRPCSPGTGVCSTSSGHPSAGGAKVRTSSPSHPGPRFLSQSRQQTTQWQCPPHSGALNTRPLPRATGLLYPDTPSGWGRNPEQVTGFSVEPVRGLSLARGLPATHSQRFRFNLSGIQPGPVARSFRASS